MHAAYSRGPAPSAASSVRDSVPAMPPQLRRCHCLHAPPPLGLPLAKPTTSYSPACNCPSPQHPSASAHCRRSQASAHSAAGRRCTQRTAEVQPRQLRHPQQTRCQRCRPSCVDVIACRHCRPSACPSRTPPPATAPRNRHSPQHAASSAHRRRPQAPAHNAAGRRCTHRSVLLRSSDVSCAILKRLGSSDAAPASRIQLTAHTAAPRLAPRKLPTTRYSPMRNRLSRQHASASNAQPAFASTRSQRSWLPMHAAYF